MKLKKFLASTALVLALGLSACSTPEETPDRPSRPEESQTSETPSEPSTPDVPSEPSEPEAPIVERIKVNAPEQIIVGEEVNLDDYIEVVGGEGPTAYTVVVPAAYQAVVTVEGHTLVALEEGEISLTIEAGAKTAKFGTIALSALKASWSAVADTLTTSWALHEFDGTNVTPNTVVHREDYTKFAGWGDNGEAGGFVKLQNGNTYSYTVNEDETEVTVDPEVYSSDFGNYFVNMPWSLNSAYFNLVKETDEETGETVEYLVMPADTPCVQYESYGYETMAEFFMVTCALQLNASYAFGDVIVQPVTLSGYETFMLTFLVNKVADGSIAGAFYYILETREEVSELTCLREYIDAGLEPDALDTTGILAVFNKLSASNYTLNAQAGWYNAPSAILGGTALTYCPLAEAGAPAIYTAYTGTGAEVVKVDTTGINHMVQGKNVLGADLSATILEYGFALTEAGVTAYQNYSIDEAGVLTVTEETYTTEAYEGVSAEVLFDAYSTATLADATAEDLTLYSEEANEDIGGTIYTLASPYLVEVLCELTLFGSYAYYIFANGFAGDLTEYIEVTIFDLGEGGIYVNMALTWDNGEYYVLDYMFTNFGTTTVWHPEL